MTSDVLLSSLKHVDFLALTGPGPRCLLGIGTYLPGFRRTWLLMYGQIFYEDTGVQALLVAYVPFLQTNLAIVA
jgi:hypothetical protein